MLTWTAPEGVILHRLADISDHALKENKVWFSFCVLEGRCCLNLTLSRQAGLSYKAWTHGRTKTMSKYTPAFSDLADS